MGFFDRFRKRVKEVADETDIETLTAEEDSQEAAEALAAAEAHQESEEDWDNIDEIEAPEIEDSHEEEWDDWDDEPEPQPDPTLSKKERKRMEREQRQREKEKRKLAKKGFDVDQVVRPEGSRVNMHVMRSTTGRKLVEVEQAPRKSVGKKTVETEKGTSFEIDLGGGMVEKGGRIVKAGTVLDDLLEELELVMLEADMGRLAMQEVIDALRN